jgi:hypothetical protein
LLTQQIAATEEEAVGNARARTHPIGGIACWLHISTVHEVDSSLACEGDRSLRPAQQAYRILDPMMADGKPIDRAPRGEVGGSGVRITRCRNEYLA